MTASLRLALVLPQLLLAAVNCLASNVPTSSIAPTGAEQGAIVVQNFYYARPGKADEVYRWRLHASDVRVHLGLAAGRVLKRTPAPGDAAPDLDLPDVVWECEYPNAAARTLDLARLEDSHEFEPVEAHMQTLIRRFRRAVFVVSTAQ